MTAHSRPPHLADQPERVVYPVEPRSEVGPGIDR